LRYPVLAFNVVPYRVMLLVTGLSAGVAYTARSRVASEALAHSSNLLYQQGAVAALTRRPERGAVRKAARLACALSALREDEGGLRQATELLNGRAAALVRWPNSARDAES
jgi:hypothetical protein